MHQKYKNVYAIGVFDLFHRGHLEFLKKAKKLGNNLIVSINSDRLVAGYKRTPIYNEKDRLELVKSCKFVDDAFIIDSYDNKEFLKEYFIDAIVHGDDWESESYKKQIRVDDKFLKRYGIELVFVEYTNDISTSDIIRRIKAI
jgi:cytidyltransferase-like protein